MSEEFNNGQLDDLVNAALSEFSGCDEGSVSSLVDNSVELCERRYRDRVERHQELDQIYETNGTIFEDVVQEMEEMGNVFLRYVCGQASIMHRRYISDVFVPGSERDVPTIVEILRQYGDSRRGGMFGFSVDGDHIHVIHDCNWSGRTCRDAFRAKIEPYGSFKSNRKYIKPMSGFTRYQWYNVLSYFFLEKWGERNLWVRGACWEVPPHSKLVRWKERIAVKRQMARSIYHQDVNIGQRSADSEVRGIS